MASPHQIILFLLSIEQIARDYSHALLADAVEKHKIVYKRLNEERLPVGMQRELRSERERLWSGEEGITTKMRALRVDKFVGAQLEETLKSLIDDSLFLWVTDVPEI
jgi:hypothetical protein